MVTVVNMAEEQKKIPHKKPLLYSSAAMVKINCNGLFIQTKGEFILQISLPVVSKELCVCVPVCA